MPLMVSIVSILLGMILLVNSGQEELPLDLEKLERASEENPVQAFETLSGYVSPSLAKNNLIYGRIQSLRGKILFDFGLYQESVSVLYEAESILKEEADPTFLARNHNYLGLVYYRLKNPQKALERHNQAFDIFWSIGDSTGIALSKNLIGGMYEKLGSLSSAINEQKEALAFIGQNHEHGIKAMILESLGSVYEDLANYDSAEFYFSKALELNLEYQENILLAGNYNNLGDVERKSGKFQEALPFYELALKWGREVGNLSQQKSALVDLAKTHAAMGDPESAYILLESARELDDEIFSKDLARQITVQEIQYEVKEKTAQIAQFVQASQFESRIRGLLIFLLFLLSGIGFLVYNRQKLKLSGSRALLEEQEKLLELKERLIQSEKENINLLESKMAVEVESQSKALSAQTLHLIEKNQMLEIIRQRLFASLETDPKEQKKRIRNLIKQIDHNFSQDTNWEDFKSSFEKVHQDFFKTLGKRGIELSPAEMKLASLIRMNLSSQEIASTLGISMDSLRISRYRLRKKIGLPKGESLQSYILCI